MNISYDIYKYIKKIPYHSSKYPVFLTLKLHYTDTKPMKHIGFLTIFLYYHALFASTLYVTDLEGRRGNIDALIERGSLVIKDNELDFTGPESKLVFGGDLVDRGPDSIKLRKWLVSLKEKYPSRVTLLWGNRDLNKLSLAQTLLSFKNTTPNSFNNWVLDKAKQSGHSIPIKKSDLDNFLATRNTEANRILWWSENRGIPKILELHKIELEELSGKKVTLDEAAADLAKSLDPKNGDFFHYLSLGQLGKIDNNTLYVHGGVSAENYRVIPGETSRATTAQEWISKLNNWGAKQLQKFKDDLQTDKPITSSKLLRYGDATWDASVNKAIPTGESVIYPYRVKENGNFRLPPGHVVEWLKNSNIQTVVVGHSPAGNIPIPLKDKGFLYMHADTSRSISGVYTTVEIEYGTIKVQGSTGNGTQLSYTVSPSSSSSIGLLKKNHIIVGETKNGKSVLFRYYDGHQIDEQIIPSNLISKESLRAPKSEASKTLKVYEPFEFTQALARISNSEHPCGKALKRLLNALTTNPSL